MTNSKKIILLIIALVIPLFCLLVMVVGGLGFGAYSTFASTSTVNEAEVEAQIIQIAADFVSMRDVEAAQTQLDTLGMPNPKQYLSFLLDRYIQEGRGQDPEDEELQNLLALANALGATTPMMVASLSTPTPIPTPTLPPTATPLPTDTPTPAPTDIPATPVSEAAPTDTPVSEATPTDIPATAIPVSEAPPTDIPEPTATPEPPPPAVDFVIAEQRMLSQQENGGCMGTHNIFVTVVDAAGNPLDGVMVEDTFQATPPHVTGEKGPGKLEYDLWQNGFSLHVIKKADGSPATSEVTAKLSSVDEDIPNEWLLQGGYCSSPDDCVTRKGINQLCRGHYSYNVTFKRTY